MVSKTRPDNPAIGRIVHDPRILDGEPVVKGTRIPVRAIVLAQQYWRTIERLREAFPLLTIEDIEQALSYYRANRKEVDRYIAENDPDTV
jgi:uncharacterized protein (DUF433 family)